MTTAKVLPFRGPDARVSDAALVSACAQGDKGALGTLFDRHAESLAAFLTRLTAVPAHEVDDLVQETFLAAFKGAGGYASSASVKTWLFGVAVHVAQDRTRKAARFSAMRARFARWTGGLDERTPDRLAEGGESLRQLQAAIASLSGDQRAAFLMCDVEELAGVEVAATLGVPLGTLYRRLHDARGLLRAAMSEGEGATKGGKKR